jgi:hypothetical protein
MPVSGDLARLAQHGRRGSDSDEEDRSDEKNEWHRRVHHDAKLAMIGVITNRVHVRHLGDG